MHAIPEHLRGVFMTRPYTNSRLPYLSASEASNSSPVISVSHWSDHRGSTGPAEYFPGQLTSQYGRQ